MRLKLQPRRLPHLSSRDVLFIIYTVAPYLFLGRASFLKSDEIRATVLTETPLTKLVGIPVVEINRLNVTVNYR